MTKKEDQIKKLDAIAQELEEHLTSLRFVGRTLTLKYKTHEYKCAYLRFRSFGS